MGDLALCLLAVWALGGRPAAAQSSEDPLEACTRITDSAARLECFDRQMAQRKSQGSDAHEGSPSSSMPSPAAAPSGAPPSQSPPAPPPAAAQPRVPPPAAPPPPLPAPSQAPAPSPPRPTRFVATIVKLIPRGQEFLFALDNGELWEQAESKSNFFIDAHEQVTIRPGVLGSFFLTNAHHQTVRVRRVR